MSADDPAGSGTSTSDAPPPEPTRRSRTRRWLLVAAPLVVGLYAVGLVVVGGEGARRALADASPVALLGALVLQVAVVLIWPRVHRASLVAVGEDVTYGQALNASMSAFTVSHTIPGGGAIGAAVAVDRFVAAGVPGPAATASATLTGSILLTTIAGLGSAGIAVTVVAGQLPPIALVLAVAGLLLLLGLVTVIVVAARSPTVGDRIIDTVARVPRLAEHADAWKKSWRAVNERPPNARTVAVVVAWSVGKWSADLASLALVFVAFGQTPRLSTLLVGFAAAQVLGAIPISPGGVGLVEGGMVGAFTALDVSMGVATTVVLAYRILETWLPVVAGVPALLRRPRP